MILEVKKQYTVLVFLMFTSASLTACAPEISLTFSLFATIKRSVLYPPHRAGESESQLHWIWLVRRLPSLRRCLPEWRRKRQPHCEFFITAASPSVSDSFFNETFYYMWKPAAVVCSVLVLLVFPHSGHVLCVSEGSVHSGLQHLFGLPHHSHGHPVQVQVRHLVSLMWFLCPRCIKQKGKHWSGRCPFLPLLISGCKYFPVGGVWTNLLITECASWDES